MKFAAVNTTALIEIGLTVGAVVFLAWFIKSQTTSAVDNAGAAIKNTLSTTLNPASPDNAVYSGVNGVGASVSGDPNFDLGIWIYDVFHPAQTLSEEQLAQTGQSGAPPLTTATGW